jgi:hypothetical protein
MSYFFTIFILATLVLELFQNKEKISNFKKYYFNSIKDWLLAIFCFLFISITAFSTYNDVPEFLRWGWTSLIYEDSSNIIFSPSDTIKELPIVYGIDFRIIGIIAFGLLLTFLVPSLAYYEERMFRMGVTDWKGMIINSLKFGFVHMIVGISIYIALLLSVIGFIYHLRYKYSYETKDGEKALTNSTAVHACYNFIVVIVMTLLMSLLFFSYE